MESLTITMFLDSAVAEYLTDLPPRRLLEAKLHEAIRRAREQIAVREGGLAVNAARLISDAGSKDV